MTDHDRAALAARLAALDDDRAALLLVMLAHRKAN